ncbi:MAG: PP2C family serine/threonine-protein phosphatase [Bacteroidota bacterium]
MSISWPRTKRALGVRSGSATHRGLVRSENQDDYGAFHPAEPAGSRSASSYLFIVADGMGGHAGGKRASHIAVQTISEVFFSHPTSRLDQDLRRAIEAANGRIFAEAATGPLWGMGTTCTAMAIRNQEAWIGHVGDSRAYVVKDDSIRQLTQDHTHVEELRRRGLLSTEEAAAHPKRSVLTRALGGDALVNVDVYEVGALEAGTRYLLCSDGLTVVAPDRIRETVCTLPPAEASSKLIDMALEQGAPDNVTVQIIEIYRPAFFRRRTS